MNTRTAVPWAWLAVCVALAAFLLSGSPWAPRQEAPPPQAQAPLPMGGGFLPGTDPGRQPTPKGRCWLAPIRVKPLGNDLDTLAKTRAACSASPYGCILESRLGEVYSLEEPLVVQCVALGDRRKP